LKFLLHSFLLVYDSNNYGSVFRVKNTLNISLLEKNLLSIFILDIRYQCVRYFNAVEGLTERLVPYFCYHFLVT